MKSLFFGILFCLSSAFAAVNKEIEFGKYSAVDVETGEVNAMIEIRPNGTAHFDMTSPDFTMPKPGCEGVYQVTGNIIISDLKCPIFLFSDVHVEIDITTVTPETVRSESGALVPVIIDLLGEEPTNYKLKIIEKTNPQD